MKRCDRLAALSGPPHQDHDGNATKMMNEDEFESRLKRVPFRRLPDAWREQILGAADVERRATPLRAPQVAASVGRRLHELFWPHPTAWGSLAAIWLVIGGIHLTLRDPVSQTAPVRLTDSSGIPTVMEMQRELLAGLDDSPEKPKSRSERSFPPQSCIERRRQTLPA